MMQAQLAALVTMIIPRGQLLAAQELHGGISCTTHRLQVHTPDQQTHHLILRRYLTHSPDVAAREFRLLQQLTASGVNSPLPLHLDQSGLIFPEPLIVMEHIDGVLTLAPRDLPSYLTQYAQQLAQIHSVTTATNDLSYLPAASAHCVEPISNQQALALGGTAAIHTMLADHKPACPNTATLLHGDYWAGNLLWRSGKLVGVIDWEDAQVGDPLIDLAIGRMETAALFGMAAMKAFTKTYQAQNASGRGQTQGVGLNYRDLAYWDLCAALRMARLVGEDLAQFVAFFPPYGRSDITERFLQDSYDAFVAQAVAAL